MSEKTVQQEDLAKALTALQDLAKGHSSGGTATTKVESMGSAGGATQVHHTPSDSDPGSWAGSVGRSVPENGATDSIDPNGTDYSAQGKVMKSIIEKLAKGQPLSASEATVYAAIAKGGFPFEKKGDKKDDKEPDKDADDKKFGKACSDDDDDDKGVKKSLADHASENETVANGLEVSEFLAGFANVMHKSLESMEARIVTQLRGNLVDSAEGTGQFQKSLAEAISRLGETMAAVIQRVDQIESQPAGAPRSVQGVQVIEKGAFAGPSGEPLTKGAIAATLIDLVHAGEATPQDVLRFDSTQALSPRLESKVRAALTGGR